LRKWIICSKLSLVSLVISTSRLKMLMGITKSLVGTTLEPFLPCSPTQKFSTLVISTTTVMVPTLFITLSQLPVFIRSL